MRAGDVAVKIRTAQVALIFKLKAAGAWQQDIPAKVNRAFPAEVQITEHTVRLILHRREPFDVPQLYEHVDREHAAAVLGTFKTRGPNKQRAKQNLDTAVAPAILDNVDETATVLANVLKTRMLYDAALHKAEEIGLSCEAVKAWVHLATDGDLK